MEAIPGYNVTIWPKQVDGRLHATRVMVVSMDPARPVNGTVLRQIAVSKILKEHFSESP